MRRQTASPFAPARVTENWHLVAVALCLAALAGSAAETPSHADPQFPQGSGMSPEAMPQEYAHPPQSVDMPVYFGESAQPGFNSPQFPSRGAGLATRNRKQARCAPEPFRPRGFGNLFADPQVPYRFDYTPYRVGVKQREYGPWYYPVPEDPHCYCEHCGCCARHLQCFRDHFPCCDKLLGGCGACSECAPAAACSCECHSR
jgi:hypothetical protein